MKGKKITRRPMPRRRGWAAEYSQRARRDLERFGWSNSVGWGLAWLLWAAVAAPLRGETPLPPAVEGEVSFPASPHRLDSRIPATYQLAPHSFPFRRQPLRPVSNKLSISLVTFPSPVATPDEENNTVHCEYYQPAGGHTGRGVIVLHILGGDFNLSRLFCNRLAQDGVSALFLKMPYYGERKPAGPTRRREELEPADTVARMRQAILDIRRAAAWLAAQPEVDPEQLGVFGISLGGITGALAAGVEPRLQHVCVALAGGDLPAIAWESPETRRVKEAWVARGVTREQLETELQVIDPLTYASAVSGRRILMINAKEDDIISRACTEKLWRAWGEPPISWYEGGHYSIGNLFAVLTEVTTFFRAPSRNAPP